MVKGAFLGLFVIYKRILIKMGLRLVARTVVEHALRLAVARMFLHHSCHATCLTVLKLALFYAGHQCEVLLYPRVEYGILAVFRIIRLVS